MTLKLHSTILATSLAATLAVGFASAASSPTIIRRRGQGRPPSLAVIATPAADYVTVETRHDGVSELQRIPLN